MGCIERYRQKRFDLRRKSSRQGSDCSNQDDAKTQDFYYYDPGARCMERMRCQ